MKPMLVVACLTALVFSSNNAPNFHMPGENVNTPAMCSVGNLTFKWNIDADKRTALLYFYNNSTMIDAYNETAMWVFASKIKALNWIYTASPWVVWSGKAVDPKKFAGVMYWPPSTGYEYCGEWWLTMDLTPCGKNNCSSNALSFN